MRTKLALDIVTAHRKSKPVHSFSERMVFGDEDLAPPNAEDIAKWQLIADYMHAARPKQLATARILSGRVDPSELINQVERHKGEDTWMENFGGDRDMIAQMYAQIPKTMMEQVGASYHPHANTVLLNERAPGVLIHELGHGVDMARREGESKFMRSMRWGWKPTLVNEFDAWRKGRQAFQEGYAASPESETEEGLKLYKDAMRSYNARKYPAYGTYLGGAAGGALGVAAGVAAAIALSKDSNLTPRVFLPLVGLGVGLGGAAGVLGGGLTGRWWAGKRHKKNEEKAMNQLQELQKDPRRLAPVLARLLQIRDERAAGGKRGKSKASVREEDNIVAPEDEEDTLKVANDIVHYGPFTRLLADEPGHSKEDIILNKLTATLFPGARRVYADDFEQPTAAEDASTRAASTTTPNYLPMAAGAGALLLGGGLAGWWAGRRSANKLKKPKVVVREEDEENMLKVAGVVGDIFKAFAKVPKVVGSKIAPGTADYWKDFAAPTIGLTGRRISGLASVAANKVKGWFGKGDPNMTMNSVFQPIQRDAIRADLNFNKLSSGKQMAHQALKYPALYATGLAGGAVALQGFNDQLEARKRTEINKAMGIARQQMHGALDDTGTRMRLGLGAIFAPTSMKDSLDGVLNAVSARMKGDRYTPPPTK